MLVGPNNSGKSTILGAFRILSEGIRKAKSRNPELISISGEASWGYRVSLEELPIAVENIFTNYDDSKIAKVEFKITGDKSLELIFPEQGACYLFCRTKGTPVRSTAAFKKEFPLEIGFVPVLGPVEHDELLYQKEAAQRSLLTHRAARNFRNIWYHYPELFDEFRNLIIETWPGMDIAKPEVSVIGSKSYLRMFCPEERYPREIYWAGFGFQVWCQLLTFVVRNKKSSLLLIDEPDIYLHSDLQRQLVAILKNIDADVVLATHSTEIISELNPAEILLINKKNSSARRITNPEQLQGVFISLGSSLNPTLTQLAKTRRALFLEGGDISILASFARKMGKAKLAIRSDFAVVPVNGYHPPRVLDLARGIELTLGCKILKAVIFDRDYRSAKETATTLSELKRFSIFAHIHSCKEIENYLLVASALQRTVEKKIASKNKRDGTGIAFEDNAQTILLSSSEPMKHKIFAQYQSNNRTIIKAEKPSWTEASIRVRPERRL